VKLTGTYISLPVAIRRSDRRVLSSALPLYQTCYRVARIITFQRALSKRVAAFCRSFFFLKKRVAASRYTKIEGEKLSQADSSEYTNVYVSVAYVLITYTGQRSKPGLIST
jgi:hypothetical protein